MAKAPEWTQKWKRKGTVIKQTGSQWALYTNTSVWDKEKKKPMPVQNYIGVLREDGVYSNFAIRIEGGPSNITVAEYGFSKAVYTLAPPKFRKDLVNSERAELALKAIIVRLSPLSYFAKEVAERSEEVAKLGVDYSHQTAKLEGMLPFTFKDLEILKGVFLLDIEGKKIVSFVSDECRKLLLKAGVSI